MRTFLIALLSLALLWCPATAMAVSEQPYIIADPRGDWGFPAPLAHIRKGPGYVLTSLVFDTLAWKNRQGEFMPALAKSWTMSPDGRSWEFALNPAAQWHDGHPVTSDDVVFTVHFLQKHNYSFAHVHTVQQVTKLNDRKVRMELAHPFAPFLAQLAGSMPILPKHIYKHLDKSRFATQKAAIGSGPYRLVKYDKTHKRYTFAANTDYYAGAPSFSTIVFLKMSPSAAVSALSSGKVDMLRTVPQSQTASLKSSGLQVIKADSGHPVRLLFNHRGNLFCNVNMRRATASALDANLIAAIAAKDASFPAQAGGMPYASPWKTNDTATYAYSPQKAKKLFAAQGWDTTPSGKLAKNQTSLTARLLVEKKLVKDAQVVARQLEEIGMTVDVVSAASGVFKTRMAEWDFDMALGSRTAIGDPQNYANLVISSTPYGDRFRKNKQLVRLLEKQNRVVDTTERKIMVQQAQQIYANELPAYQLYTPIWFTAANQRADIWYTPGGIGHGVPLPLNKLIFVQ